MARRVKRYLVSVRDTDGAMREFHVSHTSRRGAYAAAKQHFECYWGMSVVRCRPEHERIRGRRLLVIAGTTFAVAGVTMAAAMIFALSLEGVI
jgi:hypothetical protein